MHTTQVINKGNKGSLFPVSLTAFTSSSGDAVLFSIHVQIMIPVLLNFILFVTVMPDVISIFLFIFHAGMHKQMDFTEFFHAIVTNQKARLWRKQLEEVNKQESCQPRREKGTIVKGCHMFHGVIIYRKFTVSVELCPCEVTVAKQRLTEPDSKCSVSCCKCQYWLYIEYFIAVLWAQYFICEYSFMLIKAIRHAACLHIFIIELRIICK